MIAEKTILRDLRKFYGMHSSLAIMLISLPYTVQANLQQQDNNINNTTPVVANEVSSDAVAALRNMAEFLRVLKQFELKVDGHRELVTDDGQKIQLHTVSVYRASLPNKIAVETRNIFTHEVALFDGKKMTLILPDKGVLAEAEFSGSVDQLLTSMRDQYGIEFPVQDMFRWGTDASQLSAPKQALVVGPDLVNGWLTTQYAVRLEEVDFQIWIDQGPLKVPRRLVITDLSDPVHPQYTANFTWNFSPQIDDATFSLPATPESGSVPPKKVPMGTIAAAQSKQYAEIADPALIEPQLIKPSFINQGRKQ